MTVVSFIIDAARLFAVSALGPVWFLLSCLIPKTGKFTGVSTFPDFDDSTKSLVASFATAGSRIVILCENNNSAVPGWVTANNCIAVARYSLRGIWLFHRCQKIFVTHGLFSFWKTSNRQLIINIWHGMPLKNIGTYHHARKKLTNHFDFTIAHSEDFQRIVAQAFGIPRSKVLISKHPRLDQMFEPFDISILGLPSHRSLCLWLPTYRNSSFGIGHADGAATGDPFLEQSDLMLIDQAFARSQSICLIKPHPMANIDGWRGDKYSNIVLITDAQLALYGASLYNLLGLSDFLITDFSSVYFDYQELSRPIILYAPDASEYQDSRGLIDEARKLVRHAVIVEEPALVAEIERVTKSLDHRCDRANVAWQPATARLLGLIDDA